jgi:segregation and condensation protein A
MTPVISIPKVFEGPLDLLLEVVRQNQFNILDLPMAEVTRQYLAYLAAAEKFDVNLGAEWLYMAVTLIHIKSRCLLPAVPDATEAGDPRQELARQLLDHEQLRGAAQFLGHQWAENGSWVTPAHAATAAEPIDSSDRGSLTTLEVLALAQRAITSLRAAASIDLAPAAVRVEEMLGWLDGRLAQLAPGDRLNFNRLWTELPSDPHRTALFLALLEAAKAGRLELEQEEGFAPIWIHRS